MDTENYFGDCPSCGPHRNLCVRGHHEVIFRDMNIKCWGKIHFRILECRGCNFVFFQKKEILPNFEHIAINPESIEDGIHAETILYYPAISRRSLPDWSYTLRLKDEILGSLIEDVYGALNADLRLSAAIATRTVFDRASELHGIDPGASFGEKLDALLSNGKISGNEREALKILIDAGNAAAHRGWRPTYDELETMLPILETFLYRTFILESAATQLKTNIPTRHKRI